MCHGHYIAFAILCHGLSPGSRRTSGWRSREPRAPRGSWLAPSTNPRGGAERAPALFFPASLSGGGSGARSREKKRETGCMRYGGQMEGGRKRGRKEGGERERERTKERRADSLGCLTHKHTHTQSRRWQGKREASRRGKHEKTSKNRQRNRLCAARMMEGDNVPAKLG